MRRDLETTQCGSPARRGSEWPLAAFPTVGDLFQTFFSPSFLGSNTGVAMPPLDLTESTDAYKVEIDVPGYTMDQINVQFADHVLTLTGEHRETASETTDGAAKCDEGCRCHIVERTRGSFSRSIKFPVPVDAANVKAALKNGVLTVTIPKGAAARAQKIKITEA